jgi:hypothetical protein
MLALVNTPDAENPAEIREVEEPTPALRGQTTLR